MKRVTRPGGRVFLVVYGPPTQFEFLGFFMAAIQAAVPGFTGLPLDPPPLPFQVADPALLRGPRGRRPEGRPRGDGHSADGVPLRARICGTGS